MSIFITADSYREKVKNGEFENLLESGKTIIIGKVPKFKKGIYWCEFRKGLYYSKDDEEIGITRIQKKICEILINNTGEIISVDEMINYAWEGKKVKVYTFRNMIKQIRDKTYYDFIRCISNQGYTIDKTKYYNANVIEAQNEKKVSLEDIYKELKQININLTKEN